MSILTDERQTVEKGLDKYINGVSLETYPENSIITDVLVNLPVYFNSVVSQTCEIEGIYYNYLRINVFFL